MYNRPLRYLIKNDPDKVLSLRGVRLRRLSRFFMIRFFY